MTHQSALQSLQDAEPSVRLQPAARYVEAGRILTSGGISAGIDAAFHLVRRLLESRLGQQRAETILQAMAKEMEYPTALGLRNSASAY